MSQKRRSERLFVIGFLSPAVLLYGLFVIYPLVQSLVLSMYRWRGVSAKKTFVGVQNFSELAQDETFWTTVKNNLWLLLVAGLFIMVLAVALAHAMQHTGRLTKVLRSIYLFPQVVSIVVVAILWSFLYNPSFGLINGGLRAVGLEDWAQPWLGQRNTALPAVAIAFIWHALGFFVMLFAAGLSSIPSDVKEAAELDGSSGLHRFWRVTWPMLWSVKRVAAVYVVINVMNVFALVLLMTNGGPDRSTESMLTYLYEQAFKDYQFGYATAVAVANFLIAMILALIVLALYRRNPAEARN
jgi:N-acetylglucosamine transport system permease protein